MHVCILATIICTHACTYCNRSIAHFSLVLLGYSDGSVGAAIVAVILVHIVIGLYVYAAWKEGPTKAD